MCANKVTDIRTALLTERRGQHFVKCLQRGIQVNGQCLGQTKRTHTAHWVASDVGHHIGAEHLAFAQSGFEFGVVDASVTAGHQQHHTLVMQFKGQCFGNAAWLDPMGRRCQGHGGRVFGGLQNRDVEVQCFEVRFDGCHAHAKGPVCGGRDIIARDVPRCFAVSIGLASQTV